MFKRINELILLKEKQNKELDKANKSYVELRTQYNVKKFDMVLETDFKELGLTNQAMRDAYVEKHLIEERTAFKLAEVEIGSLKRRIDLINDLIELETLKLTEGE